MSDFFDELVNIGLEQKLWTTAETQEKPRKYETPEEVAMLYGISGKDGRELVQDAHPETVVITDAHDKLNGVFENIWERSDIIRGVSKLFPSATHAYQIYSAANADLVNELVKTAFYADRNNLTDIMEKADSAADNLNKVAALPFVIPALVWWGVGALGLVGGGAAVAAGKNPDSEGLTQDINKALNQINEAIEDYDQIRQALSPITRQLSVLALKANTYLNYENQLAQSLMEARGASKESRKQVMANIVASYVKDGKAERIQKASDDLIENIQQTLEMIPDAQTVISTAEEKYDTGTSTIGLWATKTKQFFVDSETTDAVKHLEVLSKTLKIYAGRANSLKNKLDELKSIISSVGDNVDFTSEVAEQSGTVEKPTSKSRADYYREYLESPDRAQFSFKEYLDKQQK